MKKIVVISDTHNNIRALEKIYPVLKESDMVIHCGDGAGDLKYFPDIKEVHFVRGNCDGLNGDELLLNVEDRKILIVHGHNFGVKSTLSRLAEYAKQKGADTVFYGHNHRAEFNEIDGITLINPGNLSKYSVNHSYCYVVINGKKLVYSFVPVV